MKKPVSYKAITVSLIVLSLLKAEAQNDSINRITRKYIWEIGIDMQGLLLRNPGTNIIFKVKDAGGRLVELNAARNYRYQLGINGNIPIGESACVVDTLNSHFYSKDPRILNVQAMVGKERVKFYGRFNFYYGCDAGVGYSYSYSGYMVSQVSNNGAYSSGNSPYYYLQSEVTKWSAVIAPFMGAKYRFSEHFSASIESAFYLSYFVGKDKLRTLPFYQNPSTPVGEKKYTGFSFDPKYLRFLTLNYHI